MTRAALLVALASLPAVPTPAAPPARYIIYVHGRIIEDQGRRPTSPDFGTYEYDAILDTLHRAGFVVLSEQRPPRANSDTFATRVAAQVDSLLVAGVPARAITVVGFSKGGWIAILASARIGNPDVSYVFMGACGAWAYEPTLHITGRVLSLVEASDSLGISCEPMFAHKAPGTRTREVRLHTGLRHGAFFRPDDAWLRPVLAWAGGREP